MFGKLKSIILNKRFITATLCLLFSVLFSLSFSFVQKQGNNPVSVGELNVSTAEPSQATTKTETFLTLGYNPYKISSGISTAGWDNNDTQSDVKYGSRIVITQNDTKKMSLSFVVQVFNPGTTGELYTKRTYTAPTGHKITEITIKYGDEEESDWDVLTITREGFVTEDGKNSFEKTVQELGTYDINKSTNYITIQVTTSLEEYFIEGYYDYSGEKYNSNNQISFTYNEGASESELKKALQNTNGLFWGIESNKVDKTYGSEYKITSDSSDKIIYIHYEKEYSKEDSYSLEIKLGYSDTLTVGGTEYYVIIDIKKKSYYDAKFEQLDSEPLLIAVTRQYKATITNTAVNEKDNGGNYIYHNGQPKSVRSSLVNIQSDKVDEDSTEITLQNISNGNAKFPSNKKYAFSGQEFEDSSGKKITLLNYGYEISSWNIVVTISNVDKYAVYNSRWEFTASEPTGNCIGTTFQEFAEFLDSADGIGLNNSDDVKILLTPNWTNAEIKIKGTGIYNCTTTYNSEYKIRPKNENIPQGTTFAYCKTPTTPVKTIVKGGIFNYVKLPSSAFSPNGGVYELSVEPVYLDDIYAVELKGINDFEPKILNNYYYKEYESISMNEYTIRYDYITCNSAVSWQSSFTYQSGLIETFINNEFDPAIQKYKEYIDKDGIEDLDLLKKVYHATNDGKYYIYLANNQPYGTLPSFEREYYENIFFKNESGNKLFKTNLYDNSNADHQTAANNYNFDSNDNKKWKQSDGKSLTAYYFRKFYYLEVDTIFEANSGLYGYAHINIKDNVITDESHASNKGGNFVAVFRTKQSPTEAVVENVKFYAVNYAVTTNDNGENLEDFGFSNIGSKNIDLISNSNEDATAASNLKIYAGCKITINAIDQAGDPAAVLYDNNNRFDSMLGYKFKEFNFSENGITLSGTDIKENVYKAKYEDDGATGTVTTCVINFEKINYSFLTRSDDTNAGNFNFKDNYGGESIKTNHLVESTVIGDKYEIDYRAATGYEFNTNPFTLEDKTPITGTNVLEDIKDETVQVYELDLNTAWLKNYYKIFNTSCTYTYDADGSDADEDNDSYRIGTIQINTKPFEFTLGVVYYNEDGLMSDKTNENIGNFILGAKEAENAGKANLPKNIGNLLTNNADIGYYVNLDGNEYALLSSRLYFPNNVGSKIDNYYATYTFKLITSSDLTKTMQVNSGILANMVTSARYEIVPNANRKVYIMLEVREIYRVDITEQIATGYTDPGTERKAEISCGDNSVAVVSKDIPTATFYTYSGLTNNIKITYHALSCDKAEAELNGSLLTDKTFNVTGDSALAITYTPKALNVEFNYLVYDDAQNKYNSVGSDAPADAGITITVNKQTNILVGNIVKITNFTLTGDYSYKLQINNTLVTVGQEYEVTNSDYEKGKIEVQIYLKRIPSGQIDFEFVPLNNGTDYDTYNINKINKVELFESDVRKEGSLTYDVVNGKEVKIKLTLAKGYTFYGINYSHTNTSTNYTFDADGKTVLISNFDKNANKGIYYIYLQKEKVNATLTLSDENERIYSILGATPSATKTRYTLNNIYIGKEIEFKVEASNTERLDYFYYTNPAGDDFAADKYYVSDGATGEVETSNGYVLKEENAVYKTYKFVVTENVINNLTKTGEAYSLNFNVKGVKRNALNYEIIVEDGSTLTEETVKVGAEDFVKGKYYDVDTEVKFTIKPAVVGKYDVTISGAVTQSAVSELNEYSVVIAKGNAPMQLIINISPKSMSVTQKVSVYNSLQQLSTSTPETIFSNLGGTVVGVNDGSILYSNSNPKYGQNQQITIKLQDETKKLYNAKLLGTEIQIDASSSIIVYQGKMYVFDSTETKYLTGNTADGYFDETFKYFDDGAAIGIDVEYCKYDITKTSDSIVISYIVDVPITIEVEYLGFKIISGK